MGSVMRWIFSPGSRDLSHGPIVPPFYVWRLERERGLMKGGTREEIH